jgi:hypothetical protein
MANYVDARLMDQNGFPYPVEKDPVGFYPVFIEIAHHKIHEGDRYKSCYFDSDLDNGDVLSIALEVGAKPAHMIIDFDAVSEARMMLFRSVTQTVSSTNALTIVNLNHNSSNTQTVGLNHTPTITVSGDLLFDQNFGSGKKLGAAITTRDENILKINTGYTFKLISAAENNKVNVCLDWYEVST